jgi:hypothetical protein
MLNTEKSSRFQCFGFSVSRNNPIQIVPNNAQELPLRKALTDKVLFDITSDNGAVRMGNSLVNEIDKAIQSKVITVMEGEEVVPRVLVGKDLQGNTYFITPKDADDYQRMMEEIKATGSVRVEKSKNQQFTGLSPIYQEELQTPQTSGE